MWCGRKWLLLLAIPFLSAIQARATTWHVEQDGSGDFTVIQDAVDAAAPGDTIYIGPGRYIEYSFVDGQNTYVYIGIDLMLIGAGDDQTIIGPESPIHDIGEAPRGVYLTNVSMCEIMDLAIENVYDGLYMIYGQLKVSTSRIVGCEYGIFGFYDAGLIVTNCNIENCVSRGVQTFGPTNNVFIQNSNFTGNWGAASFANSSNNVNVINCFFMDGRGGVQFASSSTGEVVDCVFENLQASAIHIATAAQVNLEGNWVGETDGYCLSMMSVGSTVLGTDNIFMGGANTTIYLSSGNIELHGNHILRNGSYYVKCEGFPLPPDLLIDLSENYWGTSDPEFISSWIWDGNDNSSIHAFVVYEPFCKDPIVTNVRDIQDPYSFELRQNYPNPFNPSTTLNFKLSSDMFVELTIYNLVGKTVMTLVNEYFEAGSYDIEWYGRDENGNLVASGVYMARLETTNGVSTQKLVLAR